MNSKHFRTPTLMMAAAVGLGMVVLALVGFSALYSGKIYPGVSINGVYVGGLDRNAAREKLESSAKDFTRQTIPVQYNRTTFQVPVSALDISYNGATVEHAYDYGRSGNIFARFHAMIRSLVSRSTAVTGYTYADDNLTPLLLQADEDITQPVANASLKFDNGEIGVSPSKPGHRLDWGLLVTELDNRIATMSDDPVKARVYLVTPSINEDSLRAAKHKASAYAAAPLALKAGAKNASVDQSTILSWIDVSTPAGLTQMTEPVKQFYDLPLDPKIDLIVNADKVGAYVNRFAAQVNQEPQNAVLSWVNNQIVVARASQAGLQLDQTKAQQEITKALSRTAGARSVNLAVATKEPEVSEKNLDKLGIKELISEGQTFFPGSSNDRLTNVRTGASKYNGVLLKPGETFSFGKILGDVGPAQGYVPELVILDNHEEKQYGGGLCQVSSTAYRAALLAGLPIVERHNHSFAVSYYTAPYGVPGIDATIYYPALDFKFKNDTGSYILIQTHMQGTTLTFDYFGTKTKYGEIRGPEFISGNGDTTQPSHTVFYRDVKDLSGKLLKTDTTHTYYESSTKFPIQKQFN